MSVYVKEGIILIWEEINVVRYVEMGLIIDCSVMMETTKMVMDVHQIVESKPFINVKILK